MAKKVEWIKINVDMFDNRKIRHLRRLPDGNNIVLIWVMLLTMAGRCNAGGMIFLTEDIPYTTEMIADELGFPENTVKLALRAVEQLGMLDDNGEGYLQITGWEDHQNVEGMDKIREQTKKRVQKHREQKKLEKCNAECNVTVTQGNATDKEREEERDIENIYDDDGARAETAMDGYMERYGLEAGDAKTLQEGAEIADRIARQFFGRPAVPFETAIVLREVRTFENGKYGIDRDRVQMLTYCCEQSCMKGCPGNWKYIQGVMRKLESRGITDLDAAEDYEYAAGQ